MGTISLWDALTSRWAPGRWASDLRPAPSRAGGATPVIADCNPDSEAIADVTILLVVDDPVVLEVMAEALDELCPRVIACSDAGEGLGAFSLLTGRAVLVTEVGLRSLSGAALAEAFHAACPAGGAVLTTGFVNGAAAAGTSDPRDIVLRKPFDARELRDAVCRAAALASGAGSRELYPALLAENRSPREIVTTA
jgi:DNA-binding NtrC family response regulator